MDEDRITIIGALDHKNILTKSLAGEAINMVKKLQSPVQFIEKVTKEAKTEDCLHCNGRPFCRCLLACAYLELEALENAKSLITEAIEGFRLRGMKWNEAICQWLEGEIFLQEGNYDSAKRSWKKALEGLNSLLAEFQMESKYARAEECTKHIRRIQKSIKSTDRPDVAEKKTVPADEPAFASKPKPVRTENEFLIAIPWLPVYKQVEVEAGLNGPIWTGQEVREKSDLSTTYIEGKRYVIQPARHGDKRIVLSTDKRYGWVKVHGHSMNNATPTPIQEDDYVLFYESNWPNNKAIVIVAKADSAFIENGFSYIVKRYLKEEQQLRSDTLMKGTQYEPVTITEEYRCLAVVIAVAKSND